MTRIAIVEDDPLCQQQLSEYLTTYSQETDRKLSVTVYGDGTELLDQFSFQFDIILLDIELPHLDGMTTARQIRQTDQEVLLLFITNTAQYAIQGYEVEALDYLLKPVSYFAFSQRLNRAMARLQNRKTTFLSLPVRGGTVKVEAGEILYVESQGHQLLYHVADQIYQSSGTLQQAEEMLLPLGFYRCNKGYLVNLANVDGVQDGCALIRGERLLISRARRTAFLEALTNFIGGIRS